jgi:hypothetical protein
MGWTADQVKGKNCIVCGKPATTACKFGDSPLAPVCGDKACSQKLVKEVDDLWEKIGFSVTPASDLILDIDEIMERRFGYKPKE